MVVTSRRTFGTGTWYGTWYGTCGHVSIPKLARLSSTVYANKGLPDLVWLGKELNRHVRLFVCLFVCFFVCSVWLPTVLHPLHGGRGSLLMSYHGDWWALFRILTLLPPVFGRGTVPLPNVLLQMYFLYIPQWHQNSIRPFLYQINMRQRAGSHSYVICWTVCSQDEDFWWAKIVLDHLIVPFWNFWLIDWFLTGQRSNCSRSF